MKEVTLAIDCGFGDVKICINGKFFKEISAIALCPNDQNVQDENFLEYQGKKYYVFNSATKLPSNSQIKVSNFEELKFATPLFIKAIERKYDIKVVKLCLGLSLAMMDYSMDYKQHVADSTGIPFENIYLLPQGLGSKVAYQRYNLDINDTSRINDTRSQNYLGVDIGFNTLDIFQVIDGKISTNVIKGYEKMGIIKIAEKIAAKVKEDHNRLIDIPICKEIISTGIMQWRGNSYDYKDYLRQCVEEYMLDLFQFIENEYSNSIDKMDNILIVGGGAALFKKVNSAPKVQEYLDSKYGYGFLLVPESPEYYNVLGYYAYALSK